MNNRWTSLLAWIMAMSGVALANDFPKMKEIESQWAHELYQGISEKKDSIKTVRKDPETQKIFDFICNAGQKNIKKGKNTILEYAMNALNQKYGNPKATFSLPHMARKNGRSGYFDRSKNLVCVKYDKRELVLLARLTEMCHAKQNHENKLTFKRVIKDGITYFQNGREYDALYDIPWTVEYEAHTIMEPWVVKDFWDMYVERIDTNNIQEVKQWLYIRKLLDQSHKRDSLFLEKEMSPKKVYIEKKAQEGLLPTDGNSELEIWDNRKWKRKSD